jgi:hypothetical protein
MRRLVAGLKQVLMIASDREWISGKSACKGDQG